MFVLLVLVFAGCDRRTTPRPIDVVTVPTNQVEDPTAAKQTSKAGKGTAAKGAVGTFRDGPGGFPLPADADAGQEGASGKGLVFQIERPRDAVHDQLIAYLKKEGWGIKYLSSDGTKQLDEKELMFGGYRMYLTNKEGKLYFVSVTSNPHDKGDTTLMQVTTDPVGTQSQ